MRTDHPRSRGVYQRSDARPARNYGSSPLARGLPRARVDRVQRGGIIPARAGFTAGTRSRDGGEWDHPRSRGVYLPAWACEALAQGSSPLARGLQDPVLPPPTGRRIIPARAGFTR